MKNIGVGGGQARTRRGFPRLELALLQDADRAGLMNTGLAKIKRCKGSATMKRRGFCVETPNPRNANSHIFHVREPLHLLILASPVFINPDRKSTRLNS